MILIASNSVYSVSVLYGIRLYIACVLPTLFPYLFLTYVISNLKTLGKISRFASPLTKKLWRVNGAVGYAFIISTFCGNPVGSKTVSDLRLDGAIDEIQAVRASCICSTASPTFLIASVGGICFSNSTFGALLFLSSFLTSIVIGVIFSFYKRKAPLTPYTPKNANVSDNILYDGTYSSIISLLVVGGVIVIFYLFTDILYYTGILSPLIALLTRITGSEISANAICFGLLECTRGIKELSTLGITAFSLPVCGAICGFGGLSILFQSIAYLKKAKIKTAPFVFSKLLSAVINFCFCLVFSLLFL